MRSPRTTCKAHAAPVHTHSATPLQYTACAGGGRHTRPCSPARARACMCTQRPVLRPGCPVGASLAAYLYMCLPSYLHRTGSPTPPARMQGPPVASQDPAPRPRQHLACRPPPSSQLPGAPPRSSRWLLLLLLLACSRCCRVGRPAGGGRAAQAGGKLPCSVNGWGEEGRRWRYAD